MRNHPPELPGKNGPRAWEWPSSHDSPLETYKEHDTPNNEFPACLPLRPFQFSILHVNVFMGFHSLQPWCLGVVTSMGILMLVLVILRVLAFFQSKKPLSTDVCMAVLSFFWNLSVIGLMAGMIQHGVGLAVIEVPSNKLGTIERLQRPAEILYVYALAWTKISLLLLLRHIFAVKIKRSADILGGFIGIW